MKIESSIVQAKTVAERWRKQYFREGSWGRTITGDSELVYNRLLECSNDPAEIARIVGNFGWSHISCGSCGEYVLVVVVFGENESEVKVCRNCVTAGAAAINAFAEAIR
jgi:hypothetical protein